MICNFCIHGGIGCKNELLMTSVMRDFLQMTFGGFPRGYTDLQEFIKKYCRNYKPMDKPEEKK